VRSTKSPGRGQREFVFTYASQPLDFQSRTVDRRDTDLADPNAREAMLIDVDWIERMIYVSLEKLLCETGRASQRKRKGGVTPL